VKILVFGTFDRLHPGHHFLLCKAQERGELFVVVARDATVQRIKKIIPQQNQEERMQAIASAYPGITVLLGDAADYLVPVLEVNPDLILLGYDQKLPPGVAEEDFSCPVERLEAFQPERWKSSLLKK